MIFSAHQSRRHTAPHQYRTARCVEVACATSRAIELVIAQWIAAGIDRDTDEEVLAVTGG